MIEQHYQEIIKFEDKHKNLSDSEFWELAEKAGIKAEEFVEAEEYAAENRVMA